MFDGLYARGDAAAAVGDDAWLAAMLEVEAALARADDEVPAAAAEAIAAVRPQDLDAVRLARETARHATPVVGLVEALREIVGPEAAPFVHRGATSQDVVDTAAMLVAARAREAILADARAAAAAAAALADAHRATPMIARTLLQQALPTSFGLRAATWLAGIARGADALAGVELAVQMGGPVGHRSPDVAARVAAALGLADPPLPWHAERTRIAALAGALGSLAGALGKLARDVTLLSSTEIAELREAALGGSSSMPHKRNPVASVSVLACTTRVPGLVATLLAAMPQEHERAAGAWQAEWGSLSDLLALTGSAAAWSRELLDGLEVDAQRMADNAGGSDVGAASVLIDRALEAYAR